MKLIEGVDYKKTKGYWMIPFGREFETLRPIPRPNGGTIPAGYKWDGGTGVPMLPQAKSMYGFLVHDYTFSQRDMSFNAANWESVVELGRRNVLTALIILIAYIVLTPLLLMYWYTDETKVDNRTLLVISAFGFTFNMWLLWWLIW